MHVLFRPSARTAGRRRARWSASLAILLCSGCATNPVTGRRELSLVSEADEIQMGRSASQNDLTRVGEVPSPDALATVRRIGRAMAAASERSQLPWEFHVLDDAAVNAFAYPGGFIFVTRGLLTHINSEAELAEVVGHEIGHVTAKHTVAAMSQQQLAQLGLVGASIVSPTVAKYGDLLGSGASLLFLKFGRDDELQADALGFRYSLAQGFDVRESPKVFTMLGRLSAGGGRVPEWQSTHPDPGNRAERAEQRLTQTTPAQLANTKVNRESFLRLLNGMVYGENPRHGFFRGTRFLHPDLTFELTFPAGWTTANQPDAVIGVSADKSAQLQLVPATGTPAQAVQSYVSQQGITVRQTGQLSIGGLPAVQSTFDAQGAQGPFSGIATALSYNGSTYLLVGLAVSTAAAQQAPMLEAAMRSFKPLTDASALGVQPMRVSLVTLDQAMTGAQFVQRYPSAIPTDEVLLINGIDASTPLTRGMVLKRVNP